MVYKHQYFKLDTKKREVWDENGKELSLTGRSYDVLEFLCKNEKPTVDEVGDFLDGDSMKLPDYNVIRQHPYKINKIIGHKVVKYDNPFFFIDGDIEELKEDQIESKENVIQTDDENQKTKNKKIIFKRNYLIAGMIILIAVISSWLFLHSRKPKNIVSKNAAIEFSKPQDDMIEIPAGNFLMGSTEKQALDAFAKCDEQNGCIKNDYLAEYPQHTVFVNDFYMDKEGVSNTDYKLFVDATHHSEPSFWNDSNLNSPNQPVVGVNLDDANAYCQWVGKRLPTEIEREKAARGIDGRIWPWGNIWDNMKDNHGKGGDPGLDETDGFKYSAPVGAELGISPYGLLNMAGNVWEWTTSDFVPYIGNDKYIHDDFNKGFKVLKGGAYDEDQTQQRVATRYEYEPKNRDSDIGFRCVKDKS